MLTELGLGLFGQVSRGSEVGLVVVICWDICSSVVYILSFQKRLVWDSAAISGEYLIQTIFLHNNQRVTAEEMQR